MTETPPETPPAAPPETPPDPPRDEISEADLVGLDDRARSLVERLLRDRGVANSEAAAFRHELRESRDKIQALQRQHETEQERRDREAEERLRREIAAELQPALADKDRIIATMEIKTRAAGRFADPDDAVRLLPLDDLLAETDSRKRDEAVGRALDALLKDKPYLARETEPRRPLVSQGGRSEQPNGSQREGRWLRSR